MVVEGTATPARRRDRRHERHEATRQEILDAAWQLMHAEGVAALSLRALARAVGMEPQSLYSYFDSKHAIYDALFAEANTLLLARLEPDPGTADPVDALRVHAHRFVDFCTEDAARYQLLFQRTIPGFEPSEESYELARGVLDRLARVLAEAGAGSPDQVDLWTALVSGLVNQQMSNDPGGDRWRRLVVPAVEMFLATQLPTAAQRRGDGGPPPTIGG